MFPHHNSPRPIRATYPAHLLLHLITLKKNLMRNGFHECTYPRYVAFSIPLLSHTFQAKILSPAPYVRQQSACIPPTMLET